MSGWPRAIGSSAPIARHRASKIRLVPPRHAGPRLGGVPNQGPYQDSERARACYEALGMWQRGSTRGR